MGEEIKRTICGFCHTSCGMLIHIKNGEITKVEGDKDHPCSRGYLCVKAKGVSEWVYGRDRLLYPMKKAKGGFKRISWDEALNIAADKLSSIKDKYGSRALVRCGGAPVTFEGRDGFVQFMGVYGSPNYTGAANLCFIPRTVAFSSILGVRPEADYEKTKMVIFWGMNPICSNRFGTFSVVEGFNTYIKVLKEKGIKIVVIDPLRSETVPLVDEWIPIRIGTDSALGLAMIHVIVNEELYDREFVNNWCIGFEELRNHVKDKTPEWGENITLIPAEKIRSLAREYASTKPAVIAEGNGLDMHINGTDGVRTIAILMALTGNVDIPGGNVFLTPVPQSVIPTLRPKDKRIGIREFPLFPEVPFPLIKEKLLRGDKESPKGMIVHHANPLLVQANAERTKEAFSKLDFLMVFDIFPTATAQIADLILPSSSDFERYGYRVSSLNGRGFISLRDKIIEPLGESRSVFEVEYELAQKMGLAEKYPFKNTEEWVNFMLRPSEITLKDLKNNPY
jgi:anaerobic selenocysteine-containing dehydrogenase